MTLAQWTSALDKHERRRELVRIYWMVHKVQISSTEKLWIITVTAPSLWLVAVEHGAVCCCPHIKLENKRALCPIAPVLLDALCLAPVTDYQLKKGREEKKEYQARMHWSPIFSPSTWAPLNIMAILICFMLLGIAWYILGPQVPASGNHGHGDPSHWIDRLHHQ